MVCLSWVMVMRTTLENGDININPETWSYCARWAVHHAHFPSQPAGTRNSFGDTPQTRHNSQLEPLRTRQPVSHLCSQVFFNNTKLECGRESLSFTVMCEIRFSAACHKLTPFREHLLTSANRSSSSSFCLLNLRLFVEDWINPNTTIWRVLPS